LHAVVAPTPNELWMSRRGNTVPYIKNWVYAITDYLTELGKETIVMALKIKEMVIIPAFNFFAK
jgi:hypothetical protein